LTKINLERVQLSTKLDVNNFLNIVANRIGPLQVEERSGVVMTHSSREQLQQQSSQQLCYAVDSQAVD